MARMIVTAKRLYRRSAPVQNMMDKNNVIDIISKGFSFDSISESFTAAGTWYQDSSNHFYWGGGLVADTTSTVPAPASVPAAAPAAIPVSPPVSTTATSTAPIPVSSPASTPATPSAAKKLMPDKTCFDFIKQREGFRSQAYQDSAGVWTIGYGTIMYEDNTPVKKGDVIALEKAEQLLQNQVLKKSTTVTVATSDTAVNQNQYDALVSFTYNVGSGALLTSTLLKRVKANPADPAIRDAFLMWDKARVDGVLTEIPGLKKRREDEADLYFS
jgi:lysozyme